MLTALNDAGTRYKSQPRKVPHPARRINVHSADGQGLGHNGGYDGSQGNDSGKKSHVDSIDMLVRKKKGVDNLCVEVEGRILGLGEM